MGNLPQHNAALPPESDWLEEHEKISGSDVDKAVAEGRRFRLLRTGEDVLWGEGDIFLRFRDMECAGHDADSYTLLIGAPSGATSATEYRVIEPGGETVGKAAGAICHKMEPVASPDIRAVEIPEQHIVKGQNANVRVFCTEDSEWYGPHGMAQATPTVNYCPHCGRDTSEIDHTTGGDTCPGTPSETWDYCISCGSEVVDKP